MTIKLLCVCGQKYVFDIEPVEGRMPSPIACPKCGADGTPAADQAIAQHLSSAPAVPQQISSPAAATPAAAASVSFARKPESANRPGRAESMAASARGLYATDRGQAEHQARAKMLWGDDPKDVVGYLLMNGFPSDEANALVSELQEERTKTIRQNGLRNIFVGSGLVCVPVVALGIFLSIGFIPAMPMGMAVVVGLYGAWKILNGILQFVSPKGESGDATTQ